MRREVTPEEQKPRPPASITITFDPEHIERFAANLADKVKYWVTRGYVNKVRIKYKGKPVLPDIPIAYALALEGVGLWGAGLLRLALVNLGIRTALDIELVNDAELHLERGKTFYSAGDVDEALNEYFHAVNLDENYAEAYLHLGVAYKVRGDRGRAIEMFQRALEKDPRGEVGEKARLNLHRLGVAT
ncbi:MAG: tetratricopeptide repeat protein [Candidatus Schekmanbacteria bacterium]|nr:tetratricopeptide repeat protein [Candidatus Schekmanbacteria bacterium]